MPPLEEAEPSESRRGAGGKVRRQSNRRSRITPYSRPQPNLSQAPSADAGGGWLSMLVTPARRLISSGAARILPALWSPAVESPALYSDEDHGLSLYSCIYICISVYLYPVPLSTHNLQELRFIADFGIGVLLIKSPVFNFLGYLGQMILYLFTSFC